MANAQDAPIKSAAISNAKTDYGSYYGALPSELKDSSFTIQRKQLPSQLTSDLLSGKRKSTSDGDKLVFGGISDSSGGLTNGAISAIAGERTDINIFPQKSHLYIIILQTPNFWRLCHE